MTVSTVASSSGSCSASAAPQEQFPWRTGGAALACLLLFGIPARRRRWRAMLGAIVLSVMLVGELAACSASHTELCTPVPISGTTPGTYTITVTATPTAGSAAATGTLTLTVQ
jgi:hypothetical protein